MRATIYLFDEYIVAAAAVADATATATNATAAAATAAAAVAVECQQLQFVGEGCSGWLRGNEKKLVRWPEEGREMVEATLGYSSQGSGVEPAERSTSMAI